MTKRHFIVYFCLHVSLSKEHLRQTIFESSKRSNIFKEKSAVGMFSGLFPKGILHPKLVHYIVILMEAVYLVTSKIDFEWSITLIFKNLIYVTTNLLRHTNGSILK